MGDHGQNYRSQFYYQALFSNSSDCFQIWKMYVNRAKLTAQCVYTFCQQFHSLAKCEYEFFLEHFIHHNVRGIHHYSQLLKITMIYPFALLRTYPPYPPRAQQINVNPLALIKAETTRVTFLQVFFIYNCLFNNNN